MNQAPAVHIPIEHQSAPKQSEADKAVRLAMQEVHEGKFTPIVDEEFFDVGWTALLAQHPRVQDALAKLERELVPKTNSEYEEKAQQLFEANQMARKRLKWSGQDRWEGADNEAMRLVNEMTPIQFIERLRSVGIRAEADPPEELVRVDNPRYNPCDLYCTESPTIVMPQVRSDAQVYIGKRVILGCVGLFAKVWNDESRQVEDVRVNKLQAPYSPEWSLMDFDKYGIPTRERYHGWRTALLALMRRHVITRDQAHEAFGAPIVNDASVWYRQQIQQEGL